MKTRIINRALFTDAYAYALMSKAEFPTFLLLIKRVSLVSSCLVDTWAIIYFLYWSVGFNLNSDTYITIFQEIVSGLRKANSSRSQLKRTQKQNK